MKKGIIVQEGFLFIIVFMLITIGVYKYINLVSSSPFFILTAYMFWFFRNPKRNIPINKFFIVSPAEGKVMGVEKIFEGDFIDAPGIKITIFLSPFNVHINRSPIEGKIKFRQYCQGRFFPAYKSFVSWENERHSIGIDNGEIKVLVTQIAGILARRIVSWVKLGSELKKGIEYGMIKFGSCTEIIVPEFVDIKVKKGDKVRCGETIIGILPKVK